MNIKQWQNLYDLLEQIHTDFCIADRLYRNGSNKQKRAEGEREVNRAIRLAKPHIEPFEVFALIPKGNYMYNKFFTEERFGGDMSDLLLKIREKIDCLE